MADDRSLSELLWDYTVYAPIGLAVSIAEELPKLSEKGRERIAGRIKVAGLIGRFTVGEAQRRAGRIFDSGSRPSTARTNVHQDVHQKDKGPGSGPAPDGGSGRASDPVPEARHAPAQAPAPASPGVAADSSSALSGSRRRSSPARRGGGASTATRGTREESRVIGDGPAPSPPAPDEVVPAPPAASLAIPGYDTLAASQVVQRLSSLRPDELDTVRRYEIATRGRRTILHRIAQLAADR